ncbi:MAG: DUF2062 domain-containing protein [Pseudomonadota bacterium]|nr:DUF2062 domain-containing protein [Pseudomonadota bacterium]
MVERIGRWVARNSPKREDMARNRWTRPFANRADLWRFTRRSVPRGVAVGLLVGIFLMIPGLQIVGAALLSLPLRANIPIAAAMTFLSNPATTPFILVMSLMVGNGLGFRADINSFYALYERRAGAGEWFAWLFSDAAPALVSGLFVIAFVSAMLGYVISVFAWRWWTGIKWKRRLARAEEA